jgi:hypothetical protein
MILRLLAIICLLLACNSQEEISMTTSNRPTRFSSDGSLEESTDVSVEDTIFASASPSFLKAKYHLELKTGPFKVCDSEIQILISSRMGMDGNPIMVLDEEIVDCIFGVEIDLTKIFAGFATKVGIDTANDFESQLEVLKKIMEIEANGETIFVKKMYLPPLVDSTFQPPRAFLPNIIGGSEDELANYDFTQEFTATDNIRNISDTGSVRIKIEQWGTSFKPQLLKQKVRFDDTAQIQMSSSGFDRVNTLRTFIPASMDIRISRNPLAILQINTKANIFDALVGGAPSSDKLQKLEKSKEDGRFWGMLASGILSGHSVIKLSLIKQEGLEDIAAEKEQRDTTEDLFE